MRDENEMPTLPAPSARLPRSGLRRLAAVRPGGGPAVAWPWLDRARGEHCSSAPSRRSARIAAAGVAHATRHAAPVADMLYSCWCVIYRVLFAGAAAPHAAPRTAPHGAACGGRSHCAKGYRGFPKKKEEKNE